MDQGWTEVLGLLLGAKDSADVSSMQITTSLGAALLTCTLICQASVQEEALDSLRGLNSVVSSGVSYRDYAPRVLDARVKVDKFLESSTAASTGWLRSSVSSVMSCYEAVSQLWNAKLFSGTDALVRRVGIGLELSKNIRVLGACPAVRGTMYSITPSGDNYEDLRKLAEGVENHEGELLHELWQCAGEQLASIKERLATEASQLGSRTKR
jgi:hypothetical protein